MKTILIAIIYNEERLMPHFLKHYDKYVDKFIFYDYGSNDRTLEIISDFYLEKLSECKDYKGVEIIPIEHKELDEEIFTHIKNNAWKEYRNEYDWAIIVDIDEFLILPIVPEWNRNCTIVKPEGYDMVRFEEDIPDNLFDINKGYRNISNDKLCIFNINKIQEINYNHGAHVANPRGELKYLSGAKLLHYKYLGWQTYLKKIEYTKNRMSEKNRSQGWGIHNYYSEQKHREYFDKLLKESIQVI